VADRRAWVEHSTFNKCKIDIFVGTESTASGVSLTREEALDVWRGLRLVLQAPHEPEPDGSGTTGGA
jgi:hypothetical protein